MGLSREEFRERLAALVREAGGQSALAKKAGISQQSLSHYLAGARRPSLETAVKIAHAAGRSMQWLTGEPEGAPSGAAKYEGALENAGSYILIPRHDVYASLGPGFQNSTERVSRWLAFQPGWIRSLGVAAQSLRLIGSRGDSMEPTIGSGDLLLITTWVTPVRQGSVYVVRRGDDLSAKRVRLHDKRQAILVSDNPAYAPELVKLRDVELIGRVLWRGGKVD